MACELTTGFTLGCLDGIGGVKEVLIANFTLLAGTDFSSGVTYDPTTGQIDGLPTATIYRYVPFRNSGSYIETVNKNLETGTLYFSQEVKWTFGKLNQEMRNVPCSLPRNSASTGSEFINPITGSGCCVNSVSQTDSN